MYLVESLSYGPMAGVLVTIGILHLKRLCGIAGILVKSPQVVFVELWLGRWILWFMLSVVLVLQWLDIFLDVHS